MGNNKQGEQRSVLVQTTAYESRILRDRFLLLLYLSSFVLLAILRIATGISIQRIGYFSLRHISYTPREGLRIDIRGLGLAVHRPTFAQPTWISLRLSDLCVTVDPQALNPTADNKSSKLSSQDHPGSSSSDKHKTRRKPRSQLWKKLTDLKERLKRIHREIRWIRMIDINATNTSLEIAGVGSVSVGSFTLAVHTRRKLLDRGRLFRHKKDPSGSQKPAEWILTVRSVLLGTGSREPVEMLDNLTVNVHGLLYRDMEGLRDTSVAVKIGRLYVPVDDLMYFQRESKRLSRRSRVISTLDPASPTDEKDITFDDVVGELDRPGSREAAIVQTVADSKEFFSSVLRGVQEVQLGISFIRISKELEALRQANLPLTMNVVTHEIGIDLHRLDQNAPAHRMYFSRHDVAHQALLAMVSISVSLDEDENKSNRIMYVPMATTTIKTTLPSKTMSFTQERDATERNSNILFANLVVTSPSVDLKPQHLIQLLALTQKKTKNGARMEQNRHRLISRLLPRASIKMSVQEPVVRFVLPVADPQNKDPDDYDMIISAVSSISLDVESSHSMSGELLYSLASNFRLVNHRLYYQAASGIRHSLVTTDTLELKASVSASTEVLVVVHGVLRSFSVLMVREEVSKGIYNIVRHFRRRVHVEKTPEVVEPSTPAFLRKLPPWLLELHLEGTNCSFEAAGIDPTISPQTRGMAIELESWNANYLSQRNEEAKRPASRRKKSTSVHLDEPPPSVTHLTPPSSPSRHPGSVSTDGRRLAVHVKGIQGFIIESVEEWESKPFMSIPKLEVALSTSRDMQGPIFHINSSVKSFFLEFSLYRLYSIGIAACMLTDAFSGPPTMKQRTDYGSELQENVINSSEKVHRRSMPGIELVTVDFKAGYIQVKAHMPADPQVLIQLYDLATGRHRWSAPFARCSLLRLHAESPHIKTIWARLVSIAGIRVDLRKSKKKHSNTFVEERSVEIMTDFIRLAVPHGLMMYKVFDNFINTLKASVQLAHRFKTRTNDYILKKEPEGPKHVPRISIRSKALLFELEDDAFEWKLGNIYHTGRREQMQRLAREEAFKLKVKKLQEERTGRGVSKRRAFSSRPQSPRPPSPSGSRRSRSADSDSSQRGRRSHSRGRPGRRHSRLRYDREGACALSGSAKIEADDAWSRLQEHNSRSWKKRIDTINQAQNTTIKNIRRMFIGADEPSTDADCHENILGVPLRPGLLTVVITDLHLIVDKPSFPLAQLPHFLHEVGKGMPYDMQYSLLIPLNIALDMGEARFMLRDYPLNLLHVPAIRPGQSPRLPSWSLRTDFVIAEEFRNQQSTRHIKVEIIPKGQHKDGHDLPGFSVDVVRTVSPVKTYSKPVIDIHTSQATSISWGTSYQPVIQDMMMIIEGFTKPEIDPSDRVGFWDKIRLSFHSRPVINWKGDGDVHLRLKGSRDPYVVTGHGAGFVMCWRNSVRWAIHESDDPRHFMTVKSGEYVLAIPDYSRQARVIDEERGQHEESSILSGSTLKNSASFKKVIMKVSGNVHWTAGLVFEQDLPHGGRSSNFEHHYDVVLKNPKFMSSDEMDGYDAFRGFRSQHIHLSVSIAAPFDKDWTSNKGVSSESYNSIHLSPRFFSHFYDWWSLFSGVMSLPVRQGPLWRGPDKTSKKFGRHLSTIKYGILLSPLYIAHVYKHKDPEDYQEDVVSATGLKLRIDSFILDVHQRREYFDTMAKNKSEQARTSAMKIHEAELDFINADLRAVAASIAGTNAAEIRRANPEVLASYQESVDQVDLSKFTIPDHDFSWIDMDDFVELDWVLPTKSNPETKILPLAFTPRFTYFRQTDHGDGNGIHGDTSRTSPFGNEDTHHCAMSNLNDPRKVQMALIRSRLDSIEKQLRTHVRRMGESELKVVKEGDHDVTLKQAHEWLIAQQHELEGKKAFLEDGLKRLAMRTHPGDADKQEHDQERHPTESTSTTATSAQSSNIDMDGLFSAPQDEFASDFNNRFIVHNAQVKWNNSLRNTILRYMHQVSQRRGFVYYMSRRAVKFIIDIVEEQNKKKQNLKRQNCAEDESGNPAESTTSPTDEKDEEAVVQDRIQQLLNDGKQFVNAEEETAERKKAPGEKAAEEDAEEEIAEDFLPMNAYHVRLIAPQVQLQSDKNLKSVVLLTAKGMQLKVISIMDKKRMNDDVSGMVQRRFALDMDGVQIFVTTQKKLLRYLHVYSGNRYGNAPGSSWPPWTSMEAMFDFNLDPFGFQRVIQKTSASLRYEKYNPLRLKYNEEVSNKEGQSSTAHRESRIDHLWVDFPRLRASCDSEQYYTMYIIVLDLLMYSEPLEKTRNERLEKIMLATDFSDLRGAPEMAERLQQRIRQLEEIKNHFQLNARMLDKQGWKDRIDLEKDLVNCEDELFFIMKAINTSQQRSEERKSSASSGFLRWYLSASEIVWHLMRSKDEPLLEFQLGHAAYERIDNSDGSNHNALEIERIRGWNLLPNAIYPEIIGPFFDPTQKHVPSENERKMLRVHWYMLEAIAGIPVLEEFQVTMFPLKVQLERDLGKKLFEYIFPGIGSNAFDDGGFSPLMVKNMKPLEGDEDSEGEEARKTLAPDTVPTQPTQADMRSSSPGAMGRRLQPTYNLDHQDTRPSTATSVSKAKNQHHHHHHHWLPDHIPFVHSNQSLQSSKDIKAQLNGIPNRKVSSSSLKSLQRAREGSTTSLSTTKDDDKLSTNSGGNYLLGMKRANSGRDSDTKSTKSKKQSDDLSQMLARASNYMTIAHIKLNSFVICLSYKGKSERNIEDIHDFVFRLPTLEYRNKTWSNLDLALRLKKDVIRALISHTGAIIGNKFSHSRPTKKQTDKLREIAIGNTLLPNSDSLVNTPSVSSDATSLYSASVTPNDDTMSPRDSFQSDHPSLLANGNGKEPSPLLKSGDWSDLNASEPSLSRSQNSGSQPNSNGSHPSRPSSAASAQRPRTRDSGIDPLGPLSPPRPPSGLIPARSLLKGTLGRHLSGETVKAKVRFSGASKSGPDDDKDKDKDKDKDVKGENESDGENFRRVSVANIRKKVLGRLAGDN